MAVSFKKGDDADPYKATLEDVDGAVDLTGVSQVRFYMRNAATGNKKINGKQMTVTDSANGKVKYEWDSEDVDETGLFEAEIVATFTDGDETFPSDDFKSIRINPDIEEA